uniref:Uncharacterized protein n=1 Tax=Avena sativa TaxID=4498 RepID=A0ACD5YRF2_AVESA
MASRGCRRWLGSLRPLAVVLLLLAVAVAGSPDRTAPSRPPLVLPLTLSYPNASRVASFRSRRGLAEGGRPSARMRLHDDLLTNGYYTTRLYIGTPPQEFALIVDSGSTVTYVPCASCEQCGNHQDPRFQPDLSSTYAPVKCNVDCICDSDKSQCTYERQKCYSLPTLKQKCSSHYFFFYTLNCHSALFFWLTRNTCALVHLAFHLISYPMLAVYLLLVTSKVNALKKIRGPDPNYKDICFAGAGRNVSKLSEVFPDVDMVFGNGQKLSLSPENYLFRHSKVEGAYCLGVFQNGKDPTTLLGGIVVRNTLVTYDRHNDKIGFWKTNCSELWERLHVGGAPSPASSSDPGSQADFAPAPAPSGLPEFDVGLITVYMSINVTYPNLKPHLQELADLLAKELEIDSRQVQVMNVTGQGNSTLIRWEIFPAGSSNAMSNATAMGIIYRLTQHHVQLPENLGSYKLLEWNVQQPVSRRSWLQEHVVSILVGILLVILVSLSAFLGLYLWTKKFRGQAAYRPVDSVGPEQELQPL